MADITTTKTGGTTITVTPGGAGPNVSVSERGGANVSVTEEGGHNVTVTEEGGAHDIDIINPQGPPGPAGPQNLFVQPTAPTTEESRYVWFQTGLGDNGDEITLWIEDGLA